jgi:polysaccharide biosynthesis protein PslG
MILINITGKQIHAPMFRSSLFTILTLVWMSLLLVGCNLRSPDDTGADGETIQPQSNSGGDKRAIIVASDPVFQPEAITDMPFSSLSYGIQAFLWWDGGEVGPNLDRIRMMGFTHVKQTFAWADLEPRPGEWDFSQSDRILAELEARNLRLVARLGETPDWALSIPKVGDVHDAPAADLTTWRNYCGTLAARYVGRIKAYQIWNEPNLSREWGGQPPDPAGYTELLRICSEAIRAADPEAILISAGIAPTGNNDATAMSDDLYLNGMYQAGFQQYVDVVGVHAPGFSDPATDPSEPPQGRWASFRRVEDLRKIMINNGDAARQMAILETGWTTDELDPTYAWFAVSQEEQAANLEAAYAYAAEHWRPWVGLMSAIYIAAPTWTQEDEEWWWAITEQRPEFIFDRPAFDALLRMPKVCGTHVVPRLTSPETPLVPDDPCR